MQTAATTRHIPLLALAKNLPIKSPMVEIPGKEPATMLFRSPHVSGHLLR
jgi:hypothetical protein